MAAAAIDSESAAAVEPRPEHVPRWAALLVGALALVSALLCLEVASIPGGQSLIFATAIGLWAVVILLWLGLLVSARRPLSRWRWMIVPALLVVTVALSSSNLPLRARFALSESA